MNFFLSSITGQVLNTGAIVYNGSLDSSKSEDSPGYTIDTYGNKVAPMDIIEETHHVDRASQQNEPKSAKANMSIPTEVHCNKCAFCEGASGIFDVNLVVPRTGENTCGSIKLMAANESNRSEICKILQKEEEMCCPQSSSARLAEKGAVMTSSISTSKNVTLDKKESTSMIHKHVTANALTPATAETQPSAPTRSSIQNLHVTLGDENSNSTKISSNSSLVIIMGNLRGGELAWESLYKNVLDVNSADLALIIGRGNSTSNRLYPNASLYARSKYLWKFEEYHDWAYAIDLINGSSWRDTHLPYFSKKNGIMGGVKGYGSGSGAIIFMIRWFLSQELLQHPDVLSKYERFVITRADHYYQCQHDFANLDLSNNTIWTPEGEDYGGVTDRHWIVSRGNVIDALDIFPTLFQYNGTQLQEWDHNPEKVIKRVWTTKRLNVKKAKRVMFTVATEYDTTRWRWGVKYIPGFAGLLMKYPGEYDTTQRNCPA